MHVLIVGGGELVYFLCRTFAAKGYTVTVVDRDRQECERLARRVPATVVHGDGTYLDVLEDAGAGTADALLAVTTNDQDNLVACQLAALDFDVPRTIALVNDPDNEGVFRELGITVAFSTARVLSSLIEQTATFTEVTNLIPVGEGKVNITVVELRQDAPSVGKQLMEIDLPDGSLVGYLLRDDEPVICRGNTELRAGDRLILITVPEDHGPALRVLTGDTT
ncbi:MAG: TrkA family potassium uptake protein [Candidatus Brocadiia bacterium]